MARNVSWWVNGQGYGMYLCARWQLCQAVADQPGAEAATPGGGGTQSAGKEQARQWGKAGLDCNGLAAWWEGEVRGAGQ